MANSRNHMKRLLPWVGGIAAGIATLSALFGAALWLTMRADRRVDKAVRQALQPYQHYFKGVALCQTDEYDLAVPELRKALRYMLERKPDKAMLVPVLDHYLDAIAYTLHPADYEPDFQRILEYLGKTTSAYAWHRDRIGWFYFRTSRPAQAKKELQTALTMRKGEGETRNCAWTHWALCLVHLATDDLEKALEHARSAEEMGPDEYSLENWATDERDFTRDFGVKALVDQYEPLQKNMPLFFAMVRGLNKASASDGSKR